MDKMIKIMLLCIALSISSLPQISQSETLDSDQIDCYKAAAIANYTEALMICRPIAENGDAAAQSILGAMYFYGRGVSRDDSAAAVWFRRAADKGYASAQHSLGFMYSSGRGVKRDDVAAVNWYRKAAEQGNADGQHSLGSSYSAGRGVEQDDVAAAYWYRKAADQGLPDAQFNLGVSYGSGRGVKRDLVLAYMWFNLSASSGDQDSARARDRLAERMTAAQVAEAMRLANSWKPIGSTARNPDREPVR